MNAFTSAAYDGARDQASRPHRRRALARHHRGARARTSRSATVDGADRAALLPAIADVDAVLVRSATKVDAEALAAAPQAQGRRPRRGRPRQRRRQGRHPGRRHGRQRARSRTSSAPPSSRSGCCSRPPGTSRRPTPRSSAGEWKRSKYTGVELYEKTAGIVGLGRIGVLVAQRLSAFGMQRHRLRPVRRSRPRRPDGGPPGVAGRAAAHERTSSRCTCPRPPETVGLIGEEQLATVKPSRRSWSTPPAAASSTRPRSTPP